MNETGISRRRFLRYGLEAALSAGLSGAASALAGEGAHPRPPGASADISSSCIRCGACVEVCPEHALRQLDLFPDFLDLGTPVLDFKRAGCSAWGKKPEEKITESPRCSECMKVCPSGALTIERFGSTGTALINKDKCVNCMECFRVCPVAGAVLFPNPDGRPYRNHTEIPVTLRYEASSFKPYIDKERCVGCGRCAAVCPPRIIKIIPLKKS